MNQSHTHEALAAHETWKARTLANAERVRALHMRRYPAAYVAEDSRSEGDRVRALSAATSGTGVLPTYGAARPTIAETTRRYDVDDRSARDLERAADALLRAAGFDVDAVDVVDVYSRMPTVRPDRVAFRGVVRVKVKARHRAEKDTRLRQYPTNATILKRLRTGKLTPDKVRTRVRCTERIFDVSADGTATVTYLLKTTIDRRVTFHGVDAPGYRGYRTFKAQPAEPADDATPRKAGRPAGSVWTIGTASVRTRFQRLAKADAALATQAREIATAARRALLAGTELHDAGVTLSIRFDHAATTTTAGSPVLVSTIDDDDVTRLALTFTLEDVVKRYALHILAAERRDARETATTS